MERAYTEEQKRSFRKQYAKKHARQVLASFLLMPVILLLFWLGGKTDVFGASGEQGVVIAFVPLVVAGVVFSLINWRCPACGRYLGKRMRLTSCPKCRVRLR